MNREEVAKLSPSAIVWDDFDSAIIGLARLSDGQLYLYDENGEVSVELDEDFYQSFEEGENKFDNWDRDSFDGLVAYDATKIVGILMEGMEATEELSEEDLATEKYFMALEYFNYNVLGSFVGDFTPIHLVLENLKITNK